MTAKEIQKRNAKAESLKVLLSEDGQFFVESERGKILYNVFLDPTLTASDFCQRETYQDREQISHLHDLLLAAGLPK